MKIIAKWKRLATACLFVLGTQFFAEPTTRSAPEIDPPTVLAATNISLTGFTANWSAVSGATGYKLTVDNDADFSSPLTGFNDLDVGNVTTYAVNTPLTPDVPVYYRLKSYDSSEESTPSSSQQVVFATFKLIENFENAAVGEIANGGTVINGVTFRGSTAKTVNDSSNSPDSYQTQIVSGKQSVTALGKCISLWCYDDTRGSEGEPTWNPTTGEPNLPVSNVVIDLPQDTKLTKVALDINRVAGSGNWWTSVQYSDDGKVTWKDIKSFANTGLAYRIYNEDVSLTGVDAVRINVWRNGRTDPGEMLIDNIVLYETVPNYNLTYDFEGDDAQGWTVQSGSTFTDAVSAGNGYSASISGTYCLNTAYDGGSTLDNNLQGKVRSPIITVDSNSTGIIEFIQGGGQDVNNIGLAVYDAGNDTLIARSMGENQTTMFKRVVNVSDYKDKDIYIELYDSSTGGSGHAIVDNIRIQGSAAVVVPGPVNFTATPTSATSMKLAWDAVSGASGYKVNAAVNADFSTVVTGYPKSISGTSDDLTSLTPDTTYYFSVVSVTGGSDSSPSYTNAKTFYNAGTTDGVDYYLTTVFGNSNSRFRTNYVKTEKAPENFDNQTASSDTAWYVNQSVDYKVVVNAQNQFDIIIGTNDSWSGGKVWVDWNHDGRFEDATEVEFAAGNKKELVGYFADEDVNTNHSAFADFKDAVEVPFQTITVTVPDEVDLPPLPFTTRIRIRTVDTGGGPTPDQVKPDGFSSLGQLQDYGLTVSDVALKPSAPTLTYENLTENGFTLNWTNNPYATGHYLTIATDSAFLQPIDEYERKVLGAVFTEAVSYNMPVATPLYCKISASNDGGESSESDDLIVVRDAPVLGGGALNVNSQNIVSDALGLTQNAVSAFTWEAWTRVDSIANYKALLARRVTHNAQVSIIQTGTEGQFRFCVGTAAGRKSGVASNLYELGTWFHIAMVYNGSGESDADKLKVYINGEDKVISFTEPGLPSKTEDFKSAPFRIGSESNGASFHPGLVDEIRIWSSAKAADEIQQNMHKTVAFDSADLLAYYKFEPGALNADSATSKTYNLTGTVTSVDSGSVVVPNELTSKMASFATIWNNKLTGFDVGGMALANVEGIVYDRTYVAYGPLKYDGGDGPADGQEPEIVNLSPPADLKLTVRNLSNTDAKVRLKRLFEVREEYVEATADVVFDKSQLSVIFGTTETFRLVRAATEDGDFSLVTSTEPKNNATGSSGEYAVGVEENGFITFSSIGLKDGFYTLASQGSGLTPAFDMTVTQVGNIISWTVGTEYNVSHYEVYDSEGNLIEIVNVGETYEVELPNDFGGTVKVVDKSGGSSTFSGDSDAIYTLTSGWNLISIPLVHADIFELKDKAVGGIWGWTGSAYEIVESADVTDAVWVYVTTESSATVTGVESDAEIKLNMGWNMVGPTSDCNVPANAISVHAWKDIYSQLANEKDQLHVREGYWIFCTEPDVE